MKPLATTIVGLALIITGLYLGIQAAADIYFHKVSQPTGLALLGAAASILCKEALYHYTIRVGRRIKSQLILANAWHHRSDALSSIAVLLGVAGTRIRPDWYILDSLAALIVSFFIIKVGLEILGNTLRELSDSAPSPEILDRIQACALTVEDVLSAHDLRVRTSGGLYQIEIHIEVDGKLTVAEGHRIAKAVEQCMTEDLDDLGRVIIHVDPADEKNPQPAPLKTGS